MESPLPDFDDGSIREEFSEPIMSEMVLSGDQRQQSFKKTDQDNRVDAVRGESVSQVSVSAEDDASGEVNMEASISTDDVMRAGGFGARDDISCLLPIASDSTDFEASLLDAREYEEPQESICRPGLGWKEVKDSN